MTIFAVITDQAQRKKVVIGSPLLAPDNAFLDPELTVSCPEAPTISAALDSIVHGVEAFSAKRTNVMARLVAKEGIRSVMKYLPLVVKNPGDTKNRVAVLFGAFLSAIALMHSGTGPAAGMSYPLGVNRGVPHGIGGAVFLPHR